MVRVYEYNIKELAGAFRRASISAGSVQGWTQGS